MILLAKKHTCGTQGTFNPAFVEDVSHADEKSECSLVELVSSRL